MRSGSSGLDGTPSTDSARDKKVSEDEERRGHDQIQKTTDRFTARVDELAKKKEQEVLTV